MKWLLVAPLRTLLALGLLSLAAPRPGCVEGAGEQPRGKSDASLKPLHVKVGAQEREALVAYPVSESKSKKGAAVVFVFHGHGEDMKTAARAFGCHRHWGSAIVVYMQGLKTPRPSDPKGLQLGWQTDGDRDDRFFDETLALLKRKHAVDPERIFATGFSNGAAYVFHLWAERGAVLRAVAPCAGSTKGKGLIPRPCLHIAGQKDAVVNFDRQETTMERLRELNGCAARGSSWPAGKAALHGTFYPSTKNAPFVKVIHPGGHEVPPAAGALIVEFFMQVSRK